ncbi:MAG: hypothetical protein DRH97_02960 [Chloroflexi bacterium]|nr:MAG: hypothetical protein DRH97_02960 [Chloroflexota bacterium]
MAGRLHPYLRYSEYDNNLGELRMAHHLTMVELAEIAKCGYWEISGLQNGYTAPFYTRKATVDGKTYYAGELRRSVENICKHFNESPGDLFPRDICDIERNEVRKEDIAWLLIGQYTKNEYDIDTWQLRASLRKIMATLTVREERVLFLRFWEGYTLEEVAEELGFTRERGRQIQGKALRKLRHPTRSIKLKGFVRPYISGVKDAENDEANEAERGKHE